jgi:hypothetical protein
MEGSRSELISTDPDPDPGGPVLTDHTVPDPRYCDQECLAFLSIIVYSSDCVSSGILTDRVSYKLGR